MWCRWPKLGRRPGRRSAASSNALPAAAAARVAVVDLRRWRCGGTCLLRDWRRRGCGWVLPRPRQNLAERCLARVCFRCEAPPHLLPFSVLIMYIHWSALRRRCWRRLAGWRRWCLRAAAAASALLAARIAVAAAVGNPRLATRLAMHCGRCTSRCGHGLVGLVAGMVEATSGRPLPPRNGSGCLVRDRWRGWLTCVVS